MVNQCTRLYIESLCENMNCVYDNENKRSLEEQYMLNICNLNSNLEIIKYYCPRIRLQLIKVKTY